MNFNIMFQFYKKLGLKKSGLSAGGKFNGPAVKTNLKEENLKLLSSMLPTDKEPFINFFRSCRELHFISVRTDFNP